jgi:hypothetical protein
MLARLDLDAENGKIPRRTAHEQSLIQQVVSFQRPTSRPAQRPLRVHNR